MSPRQRPGTQDPLPHSHKHLHTSTPTRPLAHNPLAHNPQTHTRTHTEREKGWGAERCRQRSTNTTVLSSFAGQVKLHSILIRTSQSASAPKTLKVFQNREDVDFEAAEDAPAEQEFELSQTSEVQDLPVKRAKFGKVQRLALFFPDNFGDGDEDVTRISYLGFKGEWMQLGRAPANILVSHFPCCQALGDAIAFLLLLCNGNALP